MRIDRLHLQTAHLEALSEFYAEKFELDVRSVEDDSVVVAFGETSVVFEPSPTGTNPYYHFAITVPSNRFDDAVAWLTDRVEPLTDPDTGEQTFFFEFMNAHAVYCLDPAGNVVELIARHDLPDAAGAFDAGRFRRVSEIGLPTPAVPRTVEALEDAVGATRWDESTDEFAVVGDDEGLFIVVETGRPWYPTDTRASDRFPVTVVTSDAVDVRTFETLPYRIEPA